MNVFKNNTQKFYDKYGPWALITGASSGIGAALAEHLSALGFNLLLSGRNEETLGKLAAKLESLHSSNTHILLSDLSSSENVKKLIDTSRNFDIGLAILNAGFGTSGLFIESALGEEKNMLALNCQAVLELSHYFARYFADKGSGGIILMSSIVGFQGVPFAANYAATKAYVQSLGEGLSHELKQVGVDILVAAPGPVHSNFAQRANMKITSALSPEEIAAPIIRALGKRATVFPGRLTKLLVLGLRAVPRWGKIRIMKMVMNGMTKHQFNLQLQKK
ncbi:MAG: SDR family NAD(P)-dependent oxidoreductase [Flavobacteriaceae bacterium]|nr:SDR family NAD(P)-dependent oxidoreductase [Flavobacteriaceae bacterium]